MLCCSSSVTTDAVVTAPKDAPNVHSAKAAAEAQAVPPSCSEQPKQDESLKEGTGDFLSNESPAKKKVTIAVEEPSVSNAKSKPTKAMMRQTVRDVTVPLSKEEGTFLDDVKIDTINF